MPYKPTGRPPGRPPKPKPQDPVRLPATSPMVKPKPSGWMGPQPPLICTECYPDGWPEGWSGIGCQHGIWTRRV